LIACDTSVLIEYLAGASHPHVSRLDQEIRGKNIALPPVVVTEILSDPGAGSDLVQIITSLPRLDPSPGYWERAGGIRARLRALRLRAPLADTLICQSCLDHDVPLLTRDADFRHFARHAGLKLI